MIGPSSYIFRSVVRLLFFLINLIAIYLLLRGHNLPGGGFIGGLATAISLILLSLGIGLEELHRLIRLDPVRLAVTGLGISVFTGCAVLLGGHRFLQHFDWHIHDLPMVGDLHIGTPLLFDVGVYLVVVGTVSKIIFVLGKSTQGLRALVAEEEARYSSPLEQPIEDAPSTSPWTRDAHHSADTRDRMKSSNPKDS